MKVTVIGTGYVGLVSGACLADVGNSVLCMDSNAEKIAALQRGQIPIYEPGLEELVRSNLDSGQLQFTSVIDEAVDFGEVLLIAVGTPAGEDGSADLAHVLAVAHEIGRTIKHYRVVVNKSTVPVGTADQVREVIQQELEARSIEVDFSVVSNPEFLKEGAAIGDFQKPERIVLGTLVDCARSVMRELYAPFNRNHDRLLFMDVRSAELTKYAANAMLATKISFMNEIASIAERVGADIEAVRKGIGSDPRIGYHFIYPGCGYGGSCFPKDVKALTYTANANGYRAGVLEAVEAVNERQKMVLVEKVMHHYGPDLKGLQFAVWGLAFKPNTDDLREAPSLVVIDALLSRGAQVRAFDPVAMAEAEKVLPTNAGVELSGSLYDTVRDADGLLILTEWKQFRSPDFMLLKDSMKQPVIFDGRNIFNLDIVRAHGFSYYGIGRPLPAEQADAPASPDGGCL